MFFPGEVGPLHADVFGRPGAAPLLLVHGMAGNSRWFDRMVPLLAQDFFVAALDFRGHGDSAWARPPRYEIVDFAHDIESARRHFGWERFHLLAHSMGARASAHYAHHHRERLAGLILVDFLTDFNPRAARKFRRPSRLRQPHYQDPDQMLPRFRLEPPQTLLDPEHLNKLAAACIKRTDDGSWTWKFDWQAFGMQYLPVWPQIAHIKTPTLIVRGGHSEVMPKDSYDRLLVELKGSRGLEIPQAHHHVPLDTPRELGEAARDFLKGLQVFL